MISWSDIYQVVVATVPLYVSMILAYLSVKPWKLFSPEQCAGINKFVAKFSIPLLSFQVIARNDPYKMNPRLILADFLQKLLAVVVLAAVINCRPPKEGGKLAWTITWLSISTLTNTLIVGIPILRAMYGEESVTYLVQIVVLQSIIWYNLLIVLFEIDAAKAASRGVPVQHQGSRSLEAGEEREARQDEERSSRRGGKAKILLIVWKKLVYNPNTYATLLGIIWACVHFRWGVKMPDIIDNSIGLLADGGLGMAMFSLGLFMASQRRIIACGKSMALLVMIMKFIGGPVLMVASSLPVGLKGNLFRMTIVQAALPQGIVPFVFAKEYNVHPEIVSTGVIFGMIITLPMTLAYYLLLAAL